MLMGCNVRRMHTGTISGRAVAAGCMLLSGFERGEALSGGGWEGGSNSIEQTEDKLRGPAARRGVLQSPQ